MRTLMLDSAYRVCAVVPWHRAVALHWLGKVEVLEEYEEKIHTPRICFKMPAVIRLKKYVATHRPRIRMSKRNIYTRDSGKCQYCLEDLDYKKATLDHVIPRQRGGLSKWTNLVTACADCNAKKGNRTPGEAGMKPVHPEMPSYIQLVHNSMKLIENVPPQWKFYIGE